MTTIKVFKRENEAKLTITPVMKKLIADNPDVNFELYIYEKDAKSFQEHSVNRTPTTIVFTEDGFKETVLGYTSYGQMLKVIERYK